MSMKKHNHWWIIRQNVTVIKLSVYRRVTRWGNGGGLPCPFLKFKEKCPYFGKKCPN